MAPHILKDARLQLIGTPNTIKGKPLPFVGATVEATDFSFTECLDDTATVVSVGYDSRLECCLAIVNPSFYTEPPNLCRGGHRLSITMRSTAS